MLILNIVPIILTSSIPSKLNYSYKPGKTKHHSYHPTIILPIRIKRSKRYCSYK